MVRVQESVSELMAALGDTIRAKRVVEGLLELFAGKNACSILKNDKEKICDGIFMQGC